MRHSASSLLKALIEVIDGGAPFPGEPLPDSYLTSYLEWRVTGCTDPYEGPLPPVEHVLSPLLMAAADRRGRGTVQSTAIWTRNMTALGPALRELDRAGHRVWAWKGLDFAMSLYPSPGDRPMYDIDLLVEPHCLEEVLLTFCGLGWHTGPEKQLELLRLGTIGECKLFAPGVRLELHTHPFYFPSTFPGSLPPDLYTSGRVLMQGLMGLRWEYALLLSLLHQCQQSSSRIITWLDGALMTERVSECRGWKVFEEASSDTGLDLEIRTLLAVLRDLPGSAVPERFSLNEDCGVPNLTAIMLRAGHGVPTLSALLTLRGRRRLSFMRMLMKREIPSLEGEDR